MRQLAARGYPLGILAQPDTGVHTQVAHYAAYAADNGCFAQGDRFDMARYLCWLTTLTHKDRCLFAVAPDVVGDAAATWKRSRYVLPVLRALGFRAALVAQDGLDPRRLDWDAFDCLFVGGTTAYKLSESAYRAVAEAKARGKWCHMGRVNSLRRLRAAAMAGYDSADGTFLRRAPDINVPRMVVWFEAMRRQGHMSLLAPPLADKAA